MELKPFVAKLVNPGEPLTAQAWNDLVNAIDNTHKFLEATTNVVKVKITNTDLDRATVRVTASRSDGPPVEAVRPIAGDVWHVLSDLDVGAYTIRAQAPGFADATQPVTIEDGDQEISMSLTPQRPIMPNVFGMQLQAALAQTALLGITVNRVLDFLGSDIAPQNTGKRAAESLVLLQQPPPGQPVDPSVAAQLVVAVPPDIEQAIAVPSLIGLTENEARKTLEQIGLVLGRVQVSSTTSNP